MGFPATTHVHDDTAPPIEYAKLVYSHGGGSGARRRSQVADNAVLGTAIFLGTETMVFAALISAFLILRAGAAAWPPAGQPRLPIAVTGLNTLVLLFSAYTMRRAVMAARHDRRSQSTTWLTATAALGTVFVVVQGSEWINLLGFGLKASSSLYGATFYTLIGCHGLHVVAAVIAVVAVAWSMAGEVTSGGGCSRLAACELYWLFVVAVWPVLYLLVYLT